MNRKERKSSLEHVKRCLDFSQEDCNPIDYMNRQADLLKAISYHLVHELHVMQQEEGERSFPEES